jgi:hypothetical protein
MFFTISCDSLNLKLIHGYTNIQIRFHLDDNWCLATKAGDTLSSRHVSSCDVKRAVGMWEAIWHWPRVSRNVCDNRSMRGVLAREPTRAPREIAWRKQSDRSVNLRHRFQCQIASHIPTARVTSYELTWREDSVSPAWITTRTVIQKPGSFATLNPLFCWVHWIG